MSYVSSLHHIVFCTKERRLNIPLGRRDDLYRFINRQIEDLGCKLIVIGGIQNHVHLLVDLHPSVPLSKLVQNIKSRSSGWMRSEATLWNFVGWAAEYYACSVSPKLKDIIINYIRNQEEHHLGVSLDDELRNLYKSAGLTYDPERYLK